MKTVSVSGSRREGVGKKDARKHRAEGRIPCVVYGGKEEVHFTVDEKAFSKLLFSPETFFISLDIDGKSYPCILKEVQYHPVSDNILHVDFQEFSGDKPITISIPLKFHGSAPGLLKGGVLIKKFRKLPVTGLPKDLPDTIDVDINNLDLNGKVVVSDIFQDKFQIHEKPETTVVTIRTTRLSAETEVPEGEAPAAVAGEAKEGAPKEKA
jgi:large subunit ribosomal protein L25